MSDRLIKLMNLFSKIEGHNVTPDYVVRGTSLKKLAETNGGGYQRVLKWAESKASSTTHSKPVSEDIIKAKEQMKNCLNLMESRNEKYGDSWKQLRLNSIVDLMIMKLDRCQKQNLDEKAMEVELEDVVNYGIFGLVKIRNKN